MCNAHKGRCAYGDKHFTLNFVCPSHFYFYSVMSSFEPRSLIELKLKVSSESHAISNLCCSLSDWRHCFTLFVIIEFGSLTQMYFSDCTPSPVLPLPLLLLLLLLQKYCGVLLNKVALRNRSRDMMKHR